MHCSYIAPSSEPNSLRASLGMPMQVYPRCITTAHAFMHLSEMQLKPAVTDKESKTFLLQGTLCHINLHLCEIEIKLLQCTLCGSVG